MPTERVVCEEIGDLGELEQPVDELRASEHCGSNLLDPVTNIGAPPVNIVVIGLFRCEKRCIHALWCRLVSFWMC